VAGWTPGPVWTRWWREIFSPLAGTRTLDHPALSAALYPLAIPAPGLREISLWTGCIWLRIGISGRLLWTRWWTFGLHTRRGISWLAERLLASQGELCSVELIYSVCPCDCTSSDKFWMNWRISIELCKNIVSLEDTKILYFLIPYNQQFWYDGRANFCGGSSTRVPG